MGEQKTIGQIAFEASIGDEIKTPYKVLAPLSKYNWEAAASAVWDEAVEACIAQVKEYGDGQNSSLEEAETEGKEGPTLVFTGATMAAAAMIDRLRSLKRSDKTESGNA